MVRDDVTKLRGNPERGVASLTTVGTAVVHAVGLVYGPRSSPIPSLRPSKHGYFLGAFVWSMFTFRPTFATLGSARLRLNRMRPKRRFTADAC